MAKHIELETVLIDIEDGIATITLNRPEKMNSFTGQMMQDIIAAFDVTDADDDVKAVIVTGSGERAFCAGADLSSGGKTLTTRRVRQAEANPAIAPKKICSVMAVVDAPFASSRA